MDASNHIFLHKNFQSERNFFDPSGSGGGGSGGGGSSSGDSGSGIQIGSHFSGGIRRTNDDDDDDDNDDDDD